MNVLVVNRDNSAAMHFLMASAAAMLVVLCGCGDGRPSRVPISGQVLVDGKPLAHGYVRFVPANGRPSIGQLDAKGRFVLTCFEKGDGAIVGSHQIEINGMERVNDWKSRWHAPKHYADAATSEIVREVDAPTDSLLIELSWNGAKPFTEIDESARADAGGEFQHRRPK